MKNLVLWILTFCLLVGFSSGCGFLPTAVPPAPQSLPTQDLPATPTSQPTDTPRPTKTAVPPTATVPFPDGVSIFLRGVTVTYVDGFNDPAATGWDLMNAARVKNGSLEVLGANWNGLVRSSQLHEGEGVVANFTYNDGSVFEMLIDHGDWGTNQYKRFGLYMETNSLRTNIFAGTNALGGSPLIGNLILYPDTPYTMMIAVVPGGDFIGAIWDPSNPARAITYHEKIGKNWANLVWTFKIGANTGTILFDNYQEFRFNSLK